MLLGWCRQGSMMRPRSASWSKTASATETGRWCCRARTTASIGRAETPPRPDRVVEHHLGVEHTVHHRDDLHQPHGPAQRADHVAQQLAGRGRCGWTLAAATPQRGRPDHDGPVAPGAGAFAQQQQRDVGSGVRPAPAQCTPATSPGGDPTTPVGANSTAGRGRRAYRRIRRIVAGTAPAARVALPQPVAGHRSGVAGSGSVEVHRGAVHQRAGLFGCPHPGEQARHLSGGRRLVAPLVVLAADPAADREHDRAVRADGYPSLVQRAEVRPGRRVVRHHVSGGVGRQNRRGEGKRGRPPRDRDGRCGRSRRRGRRAGRGPPDKHAPTKTRRQQHRGANHDPRPIRALAVAPTPVGHHPGRWCGGRRRPGSAPGPSP